MDALYSLEATHGLGRDDRRFYLMYQKNLSNIMMEWEDSLLLQIHQHKKR